MELNNIKDLRSSSLIGKTEISDKLGKIDDLRYVLINKKEKRLSSENGTVKRIILLSQ